MSQLRLNPFPLNLVEGGKLDALQNPAVQEALGMSGAQIQSVYSWSSRIDREVAQLVADQDASLRDIPPWHPNIGQYMQQNAQRVADLRMEMDNLAVSQILSPQQKSLLNQILMTGRIPSPPPPARLPGPSMSGPPPSINNGAPARPYLPSGAVPDKGSPTSYSKTVASPSRRLRQQRIGDRLLMELPENWQTFSSANGVLFAPAGARGNQGITHGLLIGITPSGSGNLSQSAGLRLESIDGQLTVQADVDSIGLSATRKTTKESARLMITPRLPPGVRLELKDNAGRSVGLP